MEFNNFDIDLLKISEEANINKSKDPKVINATVGVFLNDNNNLYAFDSVSRIIKTLEEDPIRGYMRPDGSDLYNLNVINYVLGDNEKLKETFHIKSNWSNGGSGALYMAMRYFKGNDIYLPNLRWPYYDGSIKILNKNIVEYNLFKNDKFDLNSVKELLDNTNEKEIMLLLNDPAHNPSGYNMTKEEYKGLINILNNYKHLKISVLIDIAYLEFSTTDYRKEIMPLFVDFDNHIDIFFAFSGSKIFGVYGFRLGALIHLTKNKEESENFKKELYDISQGTNGPANSTSIVFFNKIINDKDIYEDRLKGILKLKKRSDAFILELKKNNVDFYPYNSGFFLAIKTKDSLEVFKNMKKDKCYVVPAHNALRIAVSALKIEDVKYLVKIIKENIKGENK